MGFYARNTIPLTPKVVNDIHKRGGTILGTSRGGHDTSKIVDSIQDRRINQVISYGLFIFIDFRVCSCFSFMNFSMQTIACLLMHLRFTFSGEMVHRKEFL